MNSLPSERVAVLGGVITAAAAGSANTGRIALQHFSRLMAVVSTGTIAATGTVDAKWQGSVGVAGTLVDIEGAAITRLTGTAGSNKRAILDLNTDSLARLGYTHAQLVLVGGTADAERGALVLGFDPRQAPASDYDHSSVAEIVSI